MDFKGSLVEAIIPSDGTQPSAHLRKDGALPCKVVITSTHALPRHPKGFPTVKSLKTVNTRWSTRVHSEWCGCIQKPYESKAERETHWSHKYPWNLALSYTSLLWLDSNQRRYVGLLQNAPKHRYSLSLDLLLTSSSVRVTNTHKASHLQKWESKWRKWSKPKGWR